MPVLRIVSVMMLYIIISQENEEIIVIMKTLLLLIVVLKVKPAASSLPSQFELLIAFGFSNVRAERKLIPFISQAFIFSRFSYSLPKGRSQNEETVFVDKQLSKSPHSIAAIAFTCIVMTF